MKTVLITGASGLLGRQIVKVFERDELWKTVGLAFSRATGQLQKVDLTSSEELRNVFKQFQPTVVIHAAAERRPDVVEKKQEATHALNVEATTNICKLSEEYNAVLVYMSTDYVFDGKNAPYKESDEPNPLNKYGESKLEGEKVVLQASKDHILLRVPILYGPVENLDESAVTTLFKAVEAKEECKINDFQRRFPTHTEDVALVVKDLVERRLKDSSVTGVYHWSGDENVTKYTMAVTMAEAFGISPDHLKPDTSNSGGATRPYDSHLDTQKLEKIRICHRRPFKDAVRECLTPFHNK